jgi:ParB-like chromosome segregation protein Spo0J
MTVRLQNIPLDDIVPNPWRDMKLYPIDRDHVVELRDSIDDHGFFGGVKGRRRNGKVEIGCGHMRIEAARKAKLDSVPIFIDDLDDDAMLRLMTDENALQSGANPGAVMNEVAAITRRLIEGLMETGTIVPVSVAKAFANKAAIEMARGKLRNGKDTHLTLGHNVIRTYLGQGNADRSHRADRQIREAISALKQSGRYDDIVDEVLLKYPPPVDENKAAKKTEVTTTKPRTPKRRILDERCANVFSNEHQFHAFREAVTTQGAQKVLPVDKQYALAISIMKDASNKKLITATYIKRMAQVAVQEALKTQRNIDKEERELYLREQAEARIDEQLDTARMYVRSTISAIVKLIDLAEEFPAHPKIGGFATRLDDLANVIKQFSKKLK